MLFRVSLRYQALDKGIDIFPEGAFAKSLNRSGACKDAFKHEVSFIGYEVFRWRRRYRIMPSNARPFPAFLIYFSVLTSSDNFYSA